MISNTTNSKTYWDNKWLGLKDNKTHTRHITSAFRKVGKYIHKNDSVLDFGCGLGEFLEYVSKEIEGLMLFGCDHSDVAMIECTKKLDIGWSNSLDAYDKPIFDVVTCIHTLEHFEEPESWLSNMLNVVVPGGWCVVVLPLEDQPWEEHPKIWTIKDVLDLANQTGLTYRIEMGVEKRMFGNEEGVVKYPNGDLRLEVIIAFKKNEL